MHLQLFNLMQTNNKNYISIITKLFVFNLLKQK